MRRAADRRLCPRHPEAFPSVILRPQAEESVLPSPDVPKEDGETDPSLALRMTGKVAQDDGGPWIMGEVGADTIRP